VIDYTAILKEKLKYLKPRELFSEKMKKAAVLALFFNTNGDTELILTRKAQGIGYHSDQISFPGGTVEEKETTVQAALRETKEEIGIDKKFIEVIGRFHDDSVPISKYIVTPYAALLKTQPVFKLQTSEVKEIFTVPFEFFLDESNYIPQNVIIRGNELTVDGYNYNDRIIWGLTCRFIRTLVEIIKDTSI
jgi:8-oxo-dGTP pyrophosphatase MutT (NUDIX family)